ncbi:MAG: hypothetical protein NVSMB18_07300 [Acetobacteraceae bacterium]
MLSVVGLMLLGAIYVVGHREESQYEREADRSSLVAIRLSRAMASVAEAGQAEATFFLNRGGAQATLQQMALQHAQTALAALLEEPGLSDSTRRGIGMLSDAIQIYGLRSAEAIEAERAIGTVEGDGISARVWAAAQDVRKAALPLPILQDVRRSQELFADSPSNANGAELIMQAKALAESVRDLPLEDSAYASWIVGTLEAYVRDLQDFAVARANAAEKAFSSYQAFQEAWAMGTAGEGIASGQAEFEKHQVAAVRERTDFLFRAAIGALSAIFAGLAWLLGQGISRPLTRLAEVTRCLARGERKVQIAYATRRDEIGDVSRALAAFRDALAANEAASQRIYRLAHYDELTGAANRAFLKERLERSMADARRTGEPLAVLCLDLDGFKAVNDLHGHGAGDLLLREVARRLSEALRETDVAARLGGDEFAVVQGAPADMGAAQSLVARLIALVSEPVQVRPGVVVSVTTSIGVAMFPKHGDTTEALLRNADTALYRAKAAGKGCFALFEPEMEDVLRERRALEADLEHALERDELALVWQPIASAPKGDAIVGFEVLLRWRHPERGDVPPVVFIPIAETSGAIIPIGEWVLRTACYEAAKWSNPLWVAVNVSPIQVHQGMPFARMVEDALADAGLEPGRLTLEVTEGVLLRETARVQTALRATNQLGARIALDDFGTGYSSLATLRAFPFDKVKIDQSFVSGMMQESQDRAIVRAVIGLARGLGLPVVAEGVETTVQLAGLAEEGCDEVQGWLVGRPGPISNHRQATTAQPTETVT